MAAARSTHGEEVEHDPARTADPAWNRGFRRLRIAVVHSTCMPPRRARVMNHADKASNASVHGTDALSLLSQLVLDEPRHDEGEVAVQRPDGSQVRCLLRKRPGHTVARRGELVLASSSMRRAGRTSNGHLAPSTVMYRVAPSERCRSGRRVLGLPELLRP